METARTLAAVPGAAQSQYRLEIDGLEEALQPRAFRSEDHALNTDYRFLVDVDCEADLAALHGRSGRLVIQGQMGEVVHHGLIARSLERGHSAEGLGWQLELRSPLHLLAGLYRNRVFVDADPLELCQQLVSEACPGIAEVRLQVGERPRAREIIVQYEESDLDLFDRLVRWHGWYWFVRDENGNAVLEIGDDTTALTIEGSLSFVQQGGEVRASETLQRIERNLGLHPASISVRDYNYRQPEHWPLAAEAHGEGQGHGRSDVAAEDVRDAAEAGWLARIRQQAAEAAAGLVQAEGDVRHLRPGMAIRVEGAGSLDDNYLVVAVRHRASQAASMGPGGDNEGPTYACSLQLLPLAQPWRPAAPRPRRQQGLFQGRIDAAGASEPMLDAQGRYRIRLSFDQQEHPPGAASHPVRLATPYAGREHGMHFPLHEGTDILVGCINGGLERPVILGALANPRQPLPVNADNPTENRLRTAGGNELLMVDTQGRERVELFTRERGNRLVLDASEQGHSAELASEEGEMLLQAGKQMRLEVGEDSHIEVGGDSETGIEGSQWLYTRKGDIDTTAEGELTLTAGKQLNLRSEQDGMSLEAGNDFIAEADGSASLQAREGNIELLADSGSLSLSAGNRLTLLGEGGGTLHIGQGGAGIEIDTGGNLVIKGASIRLSAPSISVKGSSIGSN